MSYRLGLFSFCLLLLCASAAGAGAVDPPIQLISVPVSSQADEAVIDGIGLPVYARLEGEEGRFLLVGATPAERDALTGAGFSPWLLDEDVTSAAYYLVYPPADGFCPEWSAYGRLLLDDARFAILRLAPAEVGRLSESRLALRRLTLDPKPGPPAPNAHISSLTVTPDPTVQSMINQVDSTTVVSYTGDLSGEWPVEIGGAPYTILTRHTDSGTPVEMATQFVAEHLTDRGLDVDYHNWSYGGSINRNVIGELRGESNPDDVFIICAHLDDMPPFSTSPIAPGADDNASGSVAVLIAADILSQYRWDCSLRFALWTGEEQGLLGSHVYAEQANTAGENILGVLNFDMIAWDAQGDPDLDLYSDPALTETLALSQLFADVTSTYELDLMPQLLDNGMGASDHASFWEYGYPAILAIEDYSGRDFNSYYHTTSDRLEHLNIDYYTEFVRAAVGTFAHLSGCRIAGGEGMVRGHVTVDPSGGPIAGAELTARSQVDQVFTTTTDAEGYYSYLLPPGSYTITATAPGYFSHRIAEVITESGMAEVANLALRPAIQSYLPVILRSVQAVSRY